MFKTKWKLLKSKKAQKQFTTWIQALRSGKYKQGSDKLQSNLNSYCCLGIACKVVNYSHILDYNGKLIGVVPQDQKNFFKWLININNHFSAISGLTLTRLNDEEKFTFNEIADLLELTYVHGAL